MAAHFQDLLIPVKVVALEKVSFSVTQNPKSVCSDIDSRWEALSAYKRQLNANNSDTVLLKARNFF